jgi:hypothetical protein
MEVLGISLVVMGVISVAIFELARSGGVDVSMEGRRVSCFKGEEYEIVVTIDARSTDWIVSAPPTVKIKTGKLLKTEPLVDGRMRLQFLARFAGRADGIEVGISLTDPLRLLKKLEEVAHPPFIVDTLPVSLLAPSIPRRLTIFGFGDQPTGYPGPGHELYGLDEYRAGDTKDIIWKRVAKSSTEALTARVREANVREVVKVGVVQFAQRGEEDQAAWMDRVCEALGKAGKDVIEMGAVFTVLYHSLPRGRGGQGALEDQEIPPELKQSSATDVVELAEVVMSSSLASGSREGIEPLVDNSDLVITGLRELEDMKIAKMVSQRPLVIVSEGGEGASPPASAPYTLGRGSIVFTGQENLFPLIRKVLER